MELTCLFRVVLQKMGQITDENTSPKIVHSTHHEDSIDPGTVVLSNNINVCGSFSLRDTLRNTGSIDL